MREFLSILIMPVPVLFLLILAGIFFLWRKRGKTGRILLLGAGCWLLVISTKPIPGLLVKNLENKYAQLSDSIIKQLPDSINIIVLGGGHSDDARLSPNNQLSLQAMGRLVEGVRVFKGIEAKGRRGVGDQEWVTGDRRPATGGKGSGLPAVASAKAGQRSQGTGQGICKLIVSGYSGRSKLTQAEVLYNTALMLGMDSSEVVISPLPANTMAEAEEYVKLFGTGKPLVVVTSAIHMPRAVIVFKKAGVEVIPAPTNFILKYGSVKSPWRWVPGAENVKMMEAAVHEWVGLVWAWAGGR